MYDALAVTGGFEYYVFLDFVVLELAWGSWEPISVQLCGWPSNRFPGCFCRSRLHSHVQLNFITASILIPDQQCSWLEWACFAK